jgi:hypothetical protein
MKNLAAAIALLCLSNSVLAHDIYTNLHDRDGMLWTTGLLAGGGYSAAKWQLLSTKD